MSCDKGNQVINLYFFENGVACTPERIRKRRFDVEKVVIKKVKTFTYKGKALYTLQGEPVTALNPMTLPPHSGFVLVPNCESYLCRTYEKAFEKVLRDACMKAKSLPAITGGSDCCPTPPKKESCCPKKKEAPCPPPPKPSCPQPACPPQTCGGAVSEDESDFESIRKESSVMPCGQSPCARVGSQPCGQNNQQRKVSGSDPCGCPKPKCKPQQGDCGKPPPCVLEDSDDCLDCPSVPRVNYKCKSRKPPTPFVLRKNQGFMAKCCPCCVSQYKCEKEEARPVTSGCNPTAKLTQTTKEDFTMAQRVLKKAIKEEKQRQRLFKRKPIKPCKQKRDICAITSDEEDDDPKKLMQREKAREKYCLKRRKMEQRLKKALEKQYRHEKPC